jgi:hypothetical protein
MPLKSSTLSGDERLESCLVSDPAHLTVGSQGDFVAKVQAAFSFHNLEIDDAELASSTYGASTAAAVLAYKKKRKIVNTTYQQREDNIVGKMTIKSLDDELAVAENEPVDLSISPFCISRL